MSFLPFSRLLIRIQFCPWRFVAERTATNSFPRLNGSPLLFRNLFSSLATHQTQQQGMKTIAHLRSPRSLGTRLPGFGPPFGPPSHSAPNSAVFSGIEGSAKATHPRSSLLHRHLRWRGAHHVHKRSQILQRQRYSPRLHYKLFSFLLGFWGCPSRFSRLPSSFRSVAFFFCGFPSSLLQLSCGMAGVYVHRLKLLLDNYVTTPMRIYRLLPCPNSTHSHL